MAARALLFDLDGTLWDSFPWYASLLHEANGWERADVISRLSAGRSIVSLIRLAGLSERRYVQLAVRHAQDLPLYPRVRSALRELRVRRTPLGMVTNLPGWLVEPVLTALNLNGFFDVARFRAAKPNPQGLRTAVRALGLEPDRTIYYVGDRSSDAEAANAAGLLFA
jgi:HAD superfamily hydrolase (TIGR01549 family)